MALSSTTAMTAAMKSTIASCKEAGDVVVKKGGDIKPGQSGLTCAAVLEPELETASKSYMDCITNALLTAGDVLPFTKSLLALDKAARLSHADVVRLYKDPKQRAEVEEILRKNGKMDEAERLKAAETLLGRELKDAEKKCIMNVHNMFPGKAMKVDDSDVGPGFLTRWEVKAKQTAMVNECGFVDEAATLLTRAGITGTYGAKAETALAKLSRASEPKPGEMKVAIKDAIRRNWGKTDPNLDFDPNYKEFVENIYGKKIPLNSKEMEDWSYKLRRMGVGQDDVDDILYTLRKQNYIYEYEASLKKGELPGVGTVRLAAEQYRARGDAFDAQATALFKKEAEMSQQMVNKVTNPSSRDYGLLAIAKGNAGDPAGAANAFEQQIKKEVEYWAPKARAANGGFSDSNLSSDTGRQILNEYLADSKKRGGVWLERACKTLSDPSSNLAGKYNVRVRDYGCK